MAEAAVIFGCAGPILTGEERDFFAECRPWGFILFARNIETPEQVSRLTADLREAVGYDAPILIDQEGGRVARLRPPHWQDWQPVRELGDGFSAEIDALRALRLRYHAIGAELRELGIDVDCVPLLDVPQPNAHPIIGDRALGWTAAEVALRGREAAAGLLDAGVLPVIKHLPGHGRALHDSHEALPRVGATLAELRATDFLPFLSMRDAVLGMTAHVVYEAIDPGACATLSADVLALVRGEIGFDGLLMTDDLSMKALSGSMTARASAALEAGCDLILHCNGDMAEMVEIAGAVPRLSGDAALRSARALAARAAANQAPVADTRRLRAEYDTLTQELADVRRSA
ncbi:MAG: glycoside hydrolase family 3 N-terminal domain-containing protein [Pseudomonadota bacterium]